MFTIWLMYIIYYTLRYEYTLYIDKLYRYVHKIAQIYTKNCINPSNNHYFTIYAKNNPPKHPFLPPK